MCVRACACVYGCVFSTSHQVHVVECTLGDLRHYKPHMCHERAVLLLHVADVVPDIPVMMMKSGNLLIVTLVIQPIQRHITVTGRALGGQSCVVVPPASPFSNSLLKG